MKHVLMSTVAAIVLMTSGAAFAAKVDANAGISAAVAIQDLEATTTNEDVTNTGGLLGAGGGTATGDIGNALNGYGVYTIQNQSGLNNAAANGTNVAVQVGDSPAAFDYSNPVLTDYLVDVDLDAAVAYQAASATVDANKVTNASAGTDTGNISVSQAAGGAGIMTVQNQTGLNSAASNGMNMAVSAHGY